MKPYFLSLFHPNLFELYASNTSPKLLSKSLKLILLKSWGKVSIK